MGKWKAEKAADFACEGEGRWGEEQVLQEQAGEVAWPVQRCGGRGKLSSDRQSGMIAQGCPGGQNPLTRSPESGGCQSGGSPELESAV
jgi:hypothetical protein